MIRTKDSKLGVAVRVFYMLNDEERTQKMKRYLPLLLLWALTISIGNVALAIYFASRFNDYPLWGKIVPMVTLALFFIPHLNVIYSQYLCMYSLDTSTYLIRNKKMFVYHETTRIVDWKLVQKNFDTYQALVMDISDGF